MTIIKQDDLIVRATLGQLLFSGEDQKTKQYIRMTTYGGSLAENVTPITSKITSGKTCGNGCGSAL